MSLSETTFALCWQERFSTSYLNEFQTEFWAWSPTNKVFRRWSLMSHHPSVVNWKPSKNSGSSKPNTKLPNNPNDLPKWIQLNDFEGFENQLKQWPLQIIKSFLFDLFPGCAGAIAEGRSTQKHRGKTKRSHSGKRPIQTARTNPAHTCTTQPTPPLQTNDWGKPKQLVLRGGDPRRCLQGKGWKPVG